jgi:hypothetical protein
MATATSTAFAGAQEFLRQNHLAPLLTNDLPALQTLNKWTTVGTALQAMDKAHVLSCPVLDEDGEYFGCLSVNDVLKSLNAVLQAKDPEWWGADGLWGGEGLGPWVGLGLLLPPLLLLLLLRRRRRLGLQRGPRTASLLAGLAAVQQTTAAVPSPA